MRRLIAVIVACFALCGATGANARDIPSLVGHVTDEARLLSAKERSELESRLKALQSKSTAQVFILTVSALNGEDLFGFSQRTFEKWKPGLKKKDNGLLIVHAVGENRTRIHVGRGLEGDIPDVEAMRILQEMQPHLTAKKYFQAFDTGLTRIGEIVSGEARAPEVAAEKQERDRKNAKYLIFVIAFIALAIAHAYHPVLGGIVGAGSFAGSAWLITLTDPAIIAAAIIGGILGLILRWITDIPWCGGACGDMGSAVAGMGGDALGAGAELLGG